MSPSRKPSGDHTPRAASAEIIRTPLAFGSLRGGFTLPRA
jgi:hypothetical protein